MRVSKESLEKLDKEYSSYLDGERLDKFFDEFEINFAAGHWCAGDFCDRFAPAGYNSDTPDLSSDIVNQIERVAKARIKGIEFHEALFIDKGYKKDPSIIERVKEALTKYQVTPANMNTNLFSDPKWKLGGITNANKNIREDALNVALQGVEIAKEVGCSSAALWPGSDGWDYNFEVNYGKLLDRFIEGCVAINRKAKELGLGFGVEAKLHEPREGNMVIATTHKAALVAKAVNEECGGTNMGVAIDYGHEQMYANEPADNLYALKRFGVPIVNFHVNNAKLHSNDEDRIAGTGDIWRLVDFCYAAIDTDYRGWFGEDQFTYRTDPVKSMAAQSTGDAIATIDVVKKYLM
jgi:xylose isomerase